MTKFDVLKDLLTVTQNVDPGIGLPNAVYLNDDIFSLEQKLVFSDTWSCIGFEKDVPNKGDLFPVIFLNQPLLIVRGNKGDISVFHNVCSHRGMILVDEAVNSKGLIRCPYHSWCYDLNGALKKTPFVGGTGKHNHPNLDPSLYGLRSVRSVTSFGLIFVNLSGSAEPFVNFHSQFLQRWSEYDHVPLIHGGPESSLQFTLNANWKLAVENYCEAYHLPWIHPGLNRYSRIEDHYNITEWGKFSGQGSTVYSPCFDDVRTQTFPSLCGLSKKWDTGAEYIALYPNLLLGAHRDHFFAILISPDGPHRCHERVEIFYFDAESVSNDFQELRIQNANNWRSIFLEDTVVIEGMQKGRFSSGFEGGVFSPVLDVSTRCFHKWIAECLLSDK